MLSQMRTMSRPRRGLRAAGDNRAKRYRRRMIASPNFLQLPISILPLVLFHSSVCLRFFFFTCFFFKFLYRSFVCRLLEQRSVEDVKPIKLEGRRRLCKVSLKEHSNDQSRNIPYSEEITDFDNHSKAHSLYLLRAFSVCIYVIRN